MNKTLKNISKHALRATAISAATIVTLLVIGWKLNTDWMEAEKLIAEHIQFSDLFFRWHANTDAPSFEGRTVEVLDISKFPNREEQIELLNALADAEPYMVALDLIYPKLVLADTAIDNRLIGAVRRLPNLVLAIETRQNDTLRSFFTDSVNAFEALSNLSTSIVRTWVVTNDSVPTFAAAIAQKAGMPIPDKERELLIDYSIVDTQSFAPIPEHINLALMKGKIVIVGDATDLRDTRVVPSAYRANMRTAGVVVHKQIVQTIMAQHWIYTASVVWNWIIAYIILWLFLFLDYIISSIRHISEPAKKAVLYLSKALIITLLIIIAYLLFWRAHCYINIWWVILAPATLWMGEILCDCCQALYWSIRKIITLLPKKK